MFSQSFFKILLILIQLTTCRNTCYQPIVINRFKKNIRRISKRENDSLKCFIINYIKHFPWYFFFRKSVKSTGQTSWRNLCSEKQRSFFLARKHMHTMLSGRWRLPQKKYEKFICFVIYFTVSNIPFCI